MKKILLATALALLITGCAQQTFTVRNKPAANKHQKPSLSFLRFWNWAEKTSVAKICGGAENVKTETANIRKWIAQFYCRHLYSAGSVINVCSQ